MHKSFGYIYIYIKLYTYIILETLSTIINDFDKNQFKANCKIY